MGMSVAVRRSLQLGASRAQSIFRSIKSAVGSTNCRAIAKCGSTAGSVSGLTMQRVFLCRTVFALKISPADSGHTSWVADAEL